MTGLFLKILNMSISASWLILAVLALRLAFRKGPKWVSVLLWGIAALRLLCPFSIESRLSLIPSGETISPGIMMDPVPAVWTGVPALNRVINPMMEISFAPAPGASANPLQIWIPIFAVIWVLGVAALSLYAVVSYWRLRRGVREAVILRENIYRSESIGAPFVLGILRPKIYLPYSMEGQTMAYVLAHERAHIRRGDHWWKSLGFLLLTIHWFNPLIWLSYVLVCRDIELACDETVIRDLESGERADYTQALVACSVSRPAVTACPLAFGEVGVKERVKSVLHYKKPALWIVVGAAAVCVILAVCFLTDPVGTVRNPWIREYVPGGDGILGSVDKEAFERVSADFAIGADRYGRAVFKSPREAFETFTSLYQAGIALIQEENDLTPISEKNYSVYKKYGWQVTSGSEEARAQAAFVSRFLDIYENSFTREVPAGDGEIPTGEYAPAAVKWFDYLETMEDMDWDGGLEMGLPEFPGVTFRWYPDRMEAVTREETLSLYGGWPIWSCYLCDLTGDGLPELCSTLSMGFGMIDNRVIVCDYAGGASYALEDRGNYDYTLRWEDGRLYVDKRIYNSAEMVSSGRLVLENGVLRKP